MLTGKKVPIPLEALLDWRPFGKLRLANAIELAIIMANSILLRVCCCVIPLLSLSLSLSLSLLLFRKPVFDQAAGLLASPFSSFLLVDCKDGNYVFVG